MLIFLLKNYPIDLTIYYLTTISFILNSNQIIPQPLQTNSLFYLLVPPPSQSTHANQTTPHSLPSSSTPKNTSPAREICLNNTYPYQTQTVKATDLYDRKT